MKSKVLKSEAKENVEDTEMYKDQKVWKQMDLLFLGTGTSTGVPLIGCNCRVCISADQRNQRTRSSLLISLKSLNQKKENQATFDCLIDPTPDLRFQMLRDQKASLDAVCLTHPHADHVHGIDDLRPFSFNYLLKETNVLTEKSLRSQGKKKLIPFYVSHSHFLQLQETFPYIFQTQKVFQKSHYPNGYKGGSLPLLEPQIFGQDKNYHDHFTIPLSTEKQWDMEISQSAGLDVECFAMDHGGMLSWGFIIEKKMAYVVDCSKIPDLFLQRLRFLSQQKILQVLVIDCVRSEEHHTHLNLEKALKYSQDIKAPQTFLTHIGHELSHQFLEEETNKLNQSSLKEEHPWQIHPAYDGLKISIKFYGQANKNKL